MCKAVVAHLVRALVSKTSPSSEGVWVRRFIRKTRGSDYPTHGAHNPEETKITHIYHQRQLFKQQLHKKTMITIYITRHGNTEHNKKSLVMGQIDSPLTNRGLDSPLEIAKLIKHISFDHIYSSDLGRAFITAHIIAEKLNKVSILSRAKELREINYGIYANRKKKEVEKECPEYKTNIAFIFPEGESYLQVQKRVVAFIKELEKKHKEQTILLITHAGVIRSIITHYKKLNSEEYLKKNIPHEYIGKFVIDNDKLKSYEKINP